MAQPKIGGDQLITGLNTGDVLKLVAQVGSPIVGGSPAPGQLPAVGGLNLLTLPTGVLGLNDIENVFLGALTNGEVLSVAGGSWSNVPASTVAGFMTLNNISDVNVGFPSVTENNYVLQWNEGSPGEFILAPVTADVSTASIGALTDVDIAGSPTLAADDLLVYNGTNWRPGSAPYVPLSINTQAGTTYSLALTDAGSYVRMTNAAANTVTVPANADVAFVIGTEIIIRQAGAGTTTLASPGSPPVTLNTTGGSPQQLSISEQHASLSLIKVGTDEWDVSGSVA